MLEKFESSFSINYVSFYFSDFHHFKGRNYVNEPVMTTNDVNLEGKGVLCIQGIRSAVTVPVTIPVTVPMTK